VQRRVDASLRKVERSVTALGQAFDQGVAVRFTPRELGEQEQFEMASERIAVHT